MVRLHCPYCRSKKVTFTEKLSGTATCVRCNETFYFELTKSEKRYRYFTNSDRDQKAKPRNVVQSKTNLDPEELQVAFEDFVRRYKEGNTYVRRRMIEIEYPKTDINILRKLVKIAYKDSGLKILMDCNDKDFLTKLFGWAIIEASGVLNSEELAALHRNRLLTISVGPKIKESTAQIVVPLTRNINPSVETTVETVQLQVMKEHNQIKFDSAPAQHKETLSRKRYKRGGVTLRSEIVTLMRLYGDNKTLIVSGIVEILRRRLTEKKVTFDEQYLERRASIYYYMYKKEVFKSEDEISETIS